jgi:hypothetical protein
MTNTTKSDTETKTKTEAQAKASDPTSAMPAPVETVESLGIGPTDPYPTGAPADPEAQFEAAHGFRRAK